MGTETQAIRAACDAIDANEAAAAQQIASLTDQVANLQAALAACEAQLPPVPVAHDYWIGAGATGDGSAQDKPASVTTLDAALAAGKRAIAVLGGVYNQNSIGLSHGGSKDKPAVIEAVPTASAPKVEFIGNRNSAAGSIPWVLGTSPEDYRSVTAGAAWGGTGQECFVLKTGANWLTFRGINVKKHSRPWALYGNVEGLVIEDMPDGFNSQEGVLWNNYTAPNGAKNVTIRRVNQAGFSKSFARWSGDSDGLLIEDCVGDSGWQVSDSFAMGVFISDTAHNVVCRRVTMKNCADVQSFDNTKYWNGDGFVGENDTYNILLEDCIAEGCSDGGYDFKTRGVTFVRCRGSNNKKNFRLWGTATLDTCVSETPHKMQIPSRGGTGGTSGAYHVEGIGGQNDADKTVITFKNCDLAVQQTKPDGVAVWWGEIVRTV